ncbi:Salicylate hydroxylase [Labilithrix luteola]|uniref:squalene monooxygenase n=1 Tax=Labilithrix luteola TaxID=1391654 RepID=A0A0K1QAQ7_9BACT|nr:NAD(P)/FAD-dependent oxidoreductase [Labilithrix luteola]AKV02742.1 Salicylate hydroxylase [Labilithrix luteola]
MNRLSYDVVIAGGGFGGLVAAVSLANLGLDVAIVEPRAHTPEHALRGDLIHPRAVGALAALGLEEPLRGAGAAEIHGFAAYSTEGPPILLHYTGQPGIALEHRRIIDRLRATALSKPRIHLYEVRGVDVIRSEGRAVGLLCSDGMTLSSRLLVVADGRHSKLRTALGLSATSTVLSHSVGATVSAELLPHPSYGHVFAGTKGPILAYPLGDGFARVNVDVPMGSPRGRDALPEYLSTHFDAHMPRALLNAAVTAFGTQPLLGAANHAVITEACAVHGAVLLGDAGGASHPFTATGMTSAVNDAITLAAAVAQYGLCDRALVAYQRRRYRFVRVREAFAQGLYDIFRANDPATRALRNGLFRYWRSARGRRASMQLLAGEDSSARTFLTEYAHVVAATSGEAMAEARRDLALGPIVAAFRGLGFAGRTSVAITWERARMDVLGRSLDAIDRTGGSPRAVRAARINGTSDVGAAE